MEKARNLHPSFVKEVSKIFVNIYVIVHCQPCCQPCAKDPLLRKYSTVSLWWKENFSFRHWANSRNHYVFQERLLTTFFYRYYFFMENIWKNRTIIQVSIKNKYIFLSNMTIKNYCFDWFMFIFIFHKICIRLSDVKLKGMLLLKHLTICREFEFYSRIREKVGNLRSIREICRKIGKICRSLWPLVVINALCVVFR